MVKQDTTIVRLRIIYDGTPPNTWDGSAADFGVQDKENVLYPGKTGPSGHVVFEIAVDATPGKTAAPKFLGDFTHGKPNERFLYLSWRNANGAYAQRLKLPLGGISWSDIEKAGSAPLIGEVAPSNKPRKPGGTNIGGTRATTWKASSK